MRLKIKLLAVITLIGIVAFNLSACSTNAFQADAAVRIDKNQETVVVLHGLGRSASAMSSIAEHLENAGYRVENIGYRSFQNTPENILNSIEEQLSHRALDQAPKVHFVGHSLGGLLIRGYLEDHKLNNLGHVVMLGSPNHGTPVVDKYRDRWWFQLAGPMTLALGTDENSFPNRLSAPYYPVGVIAGIKDQDNEDLIPGVDDGLVGLESTKLEGMKDFISLEIGHSMMRRDENVAKQTIAFLQNGTFKH